MATRTTLPNWLALAGTNVHPGSENYAPMISALEHVFKAVTTIETTGLVEFPTMTASPVAGPSDMITLSFLWAQISEAGKAHHELRPQCKRAHNGLRVLFAIVERKPIPDLTGKRQKAEIV